MIIAREELTRGVPNGCAGVWPIFAHGDLGAIDHADKYLFVEVIVN
jgi:hypothetical protein